MRKNNLKKKRARRGRAKIRGTGERPRLCVFRSSKNVYVQLIDDSTGKTIAGFDSRKLSAKDGKAENNVETAKKVGQEIAKIAKEKKIRKVVFDRHGYKYHGKAKAVAEGVREGGLLF